MIKEKSWTAVIVDVLKNLKAVEAGGSEARIRAAVERVKEKWGLDLSKPGVRAYLEGESRAARISLDGLVLYEQLGRLVEDLREPARGGSVA